MPNYEYKCKNCNKQITHFQNISDDSLTICPFCGGELVRLLSGGGGVIYKGSGFYVNDYNTEKKKQIQKEKTSATS